MARSAGIDTSVAPVSSMKSTGWPLIWPLATKCPCALLTSFTSMKPSPCSELTTTFGFCCRASHWAKNRVARNSAAHQASTMNTRPMRCPGVCCLTAWHSSHRPVPRSARPPDALHHRRAHRSYCRHRSRHPRHRRSTLLPTRSPVDNDGFPAITRRRTTSSARPWPSADPGDKSDRRCVQG
ncbi:hypothetical protein D3C85_1400410 [compost metagenome]